MKISVLIICSDRVEELSRCLCSLELLDGLLTEVLVLKNAPDKPWPNDFVESLPACVRMSLHIVESGRRVFPTTGRNQLAAHASGDAYLFLDDDSFVLSRNGIENGLDVLQSERRVGSIAYPQCTEAGRVAPFTQPAPVDYSCYTCGFMTCGAMVRGDVFHQLGGFQELLQMAHEENEFCKRQWNAGYAVVYLPDTCICHNPSPNARNSRQRAMLNARNGWYQAVLHEPLWLLMLTIGPRFLQSARYLHKANSWTGGNWLPLMVECAANLGRDLPSLWRSRQALQFSTFRRWRYIKQHYEPYQKVQ